MKNKNFIQRTRRFSLTISSALRFIRRFNQSSELQSNHTTPLKNILLMYLDSFFISIGFNSSSYSFFHDCISSNNHRSEPHIKLKLLPLKIPRRLAENRQ